MRDDPPYGLDDPQQTPDPAGVRDRVRAPAIFLLVVNGLNLLAGLYMLVDSIVLKKDGADVEAQIEDQWKEMPQDQRDLYASVGWGSPQAIFVSLTSFILGWGGVTALVGAIGLFGSMRMLSLHSYGLAMTGAILTAIPCTTPCCLIGQIAGIWGVIVLMNADVRKAFH